MSIDLETRGHGVQGKGRQLAAFIIIRRDDHRALMQFQTPDWSRETGLDSSRGT